MRVAAFALIGAVAAAACASPARAPQILPGVAPGVWEISRTASGHGARRACLRDVALFATYAHAGDTCRRTILLNEPTRLVMNLECGPGDFGRSDITVTTPRSLKLTSQGFHKGEPYALTAYARRVGECPARGGR